MDTTPKKQTFRQWLLGRIAYVLGFFALITSSKAEREYVFQWMLGAFDMTAQGFTTPHPDQEKAVWAIDQFKEALEHQRRQTAPATPPRHAPNWESIARVEEWAKKRREET